MQIAHVFVYPDQWSAAQQVGMDFGGGSQMKMKYEGKFVTVHIAACSIDQYEQFLRIVRPQKGN